MNQEEWESLCDGCGKCCLHKLRNAETGRVYLTAVACKLLDGNTCRCRDYENRRQHVPDCLDLSPDTLEELDWLPDTCAYRLLNEGKDLPEWHPLITGDPDSTIRYGMSVAGYTIPEESAGNPENYILWENE
ncbi:MAG: YcgN family cysteine cluster protein [Spirochaetales bacterium]|nr:YcgN family cysteine cluster protein [Spirochaetales bacterium]